MTEQRDLRYRLSRRGFVGGTAGAAALLALGGPRAIQYASAQDACGQFRKASRSGFMSRRSEPCSGR